MADGTQNADTFNAPAGNSNFNGLGGVDTIVFNFALTSATFTWSGNQVIVDTATSHTVLTGFEIYQFTDGTVNNDDGSPLIDDLFYNATYHDIWAAHVDADAHYNSTGWHEKRDPNAFFSTSIYLSINQDVKAAGVNPLTHFDTSGWKEGRNPGPNFDVHQYLVANPDVAASNVDPLRHFLLSGAQEGRQPFAAAPLVATNGFDYNYYLANNPDVAASGVDAFQHFQTFGWHEGRNPNAFFDVAGYLQTYPDIAAAGVNPLDHYHLSGFKEGRNPSPLFDTAAYLAANPDVAAANVDPLQHYLQFGIQEGRVAIPSAVLDTNAAANSIAEGAANGSGTGLVVSWGGWVSPALTYTLTGDTSGGGFTVNPATGVITVLDSTKLDFETAPSHAYSVTVQAHEGSQTKSQVFIIAVADVAPTAPVDTNGASDGVTEGVANGVAVGITANSTDVNGGAIVYSLANNAGGRFQINAGTGVVTTGPNANLINYEDNASHSYTITVAASDGTLTSTTDYVIPIGDVAPTQPTDANGATNTIVEGSTTGVAVGVTVASTDVNGGALTYRFADLGGGVFGDAGGRFQINSVTGVVSVSAAGAATIDYEGAPGHAYTITVEASDGTLASLTQSFVIAVTNANPSAPVDSDGASGGSVQEGSATGTAVGITGFSTDPAGTALTYSLGDDLNKRFQVDPTTGVVSLGVNAGLIDFETSPSYNITLYASDGQGGSNATTFTIAITNAPPATPADVNGAANTVTEGVGSGQATGVTFQAADPGGTTVTYSLTDDAGGRFQIDTNTGVVTTGPSANLIDFETAAGHAYNITVQASDGNGGVSSQTLAIAVADAPPGTFTDTNAAANTVVEDAANDTLIGVHANAIDPNGGTVTYSFANAADSANGAFKVDSATGVISVADHTKIDFESSAGAYVVTVTATTAGGTLTSTNGFTINVADLAPPQPADTDNATDTVTEGAAAGTAVGITAQSLDVNGGAVSYSLTNSAGGLFVIDSVTGIVTVTAAGATGIDFESSGGSYAIQVQASDGTLASTQDFAITVGNVLPPQPTDANGAANAVADTASNGDTVGVTLSSTDVNGGTVTYQLTDTQGGRFAVNANTGVVTVADASLIDALDGSYTIVGRASDSTGGGATQSFVINVTTNQLHVDLDGNDSGAAGNAFAALFTEQLAATAVADTDVVITNPGNPGLNAISATIVLTNAQAGDSLAVNGALPAGISSVITPGAGTITVTLSGSATYASYQTALHQIVFSTTGDAPNTTPRILSVQVSDSSGSSNVATSTITVAAVNDTPDLTPNAPVLAAYTENGSAAALLATGAVTDADNPASFAGGSFTAAITANGAAGDQIVLLASSPFSISGTTLLHGGDAIGTVTFVSGATASVTVSALTAFATPTVVNELVQAFGFQTPSDNPSTASRTVTFTFDDGGNTGSPGALNDSVTQTVTVTAVNDAPVNTVPAATQIIASGATDVAISGVSVSDVDGNAANETTQLTTAHGNLKVVLQGAATISAGASNTHTLTISGTLTDINATLATLTYTPDVSFAGADALQVVTNDGGATGGGALSDTDTIGIAVTAGGTNPTIDLDLDNSSTATVNDYTTTFIEAGAAVAIVDADVTIVDTAGADVTDAIKSATITLTNHQAGDVLSVVGALPTGISASAYDAATGVLTLSSLTTNTAAEYQTALQQITFSNPGGNPATVDRTIIVTVKDDLNVDSNTALTTIHISTANDAPALDLDANNSSGAAGLDFTAQYTVGGAAAAIADTDTTITDADDTNIESATVVLTTGDASDALSIAGALPAGISAVITPGVGTITVALSGSASKAAYQAALHQIVFTSADPAVAPADRSVTVTVNDGTDPSNTATTTIEIVPNAAPIAANDSGAAIEAGGLNNAIAGANPSGNVITGPGADNDPDGPQAAITVVAVRTGAEGGAGTAGTVGSALFGSFGTLTLNADGSYTYVVDNTNATVQALRLTGQTVVDTFTYTVQDGLGASDTAGNNGTNSLATLTITIDGRNDTPVAVADAASATEAGGAANATLGVDPAGNVLTNDTDVDSAANGETQTVVGAAAGVSAGPLAGNVGTGLHGIGVLDYGTLTIAAGGAYTYAVNNSNLAVQALRTSAQTLTDTFSYTVQDAAGLTSTTQVTVTIHGANDNPVANNDTATATEAGGTNNGTPGTNISNFNVLTGVGAGSLADTDPDSAANGETQIVQGVAVGDQGNTVLSSNVATGIHGSGLLDFGTLTLNSNGSYSYVVNQSNTTIQQLNSGQFVTDTFTYTMHDTAGVLDNATITITINGANDAPVANDDGTPSPFVVLQSRANSPTGNLLTNDTDIDTASGLTAIKNTNTVHGGVVVVNADGTFTVDYTGVTYLGLDSFTYHTNDNGTPNLSSAPATVFLDVQPKIWHIDNTASAVGADGSAAHPWNSIAAFNTANAGAIAANRPDIVFLHTGTGTYSEPDGVNLTNNQTLLGQGVDLTYTRSDATVVTLTDFATNVAPVIQLTGAGQGVTLAQNNTLKGFDIDTGTQTGAIGIEDSNAAGIAGSVGTLNISNGVDITGQGKAIDIDQGGTLNVTFASITSGSNANNLSGSTTEGIQLGGVVGSLLGGTFTVSGATIIRNADTTGIQVSNTAANASFNFGTTTVTDDFIGAGRNGNGIDLSTAIGTTNSFNFGNLSITTDAGFGLKAASAGTLTFGATNSIVATGGSAVDLTSTNLSGATFATVSSSGGATGINIVTPGTGAFVANGGTLSGHSTAEINLSGGSADFTYAGTINDGTGLSVQIASKTGGTTTISGSINDGADAGGGIAISNNTAGTINFTGATKTLNTGASAGVNLATNTGTTINFTNGGLDIDTTSGAGFSATGGGTVSVTGTANHLTSTTGTALNVVSTTIGTSGLTFQDIAANGGANGIILNTTGSGGLTVTGIGTTAGSGGTIQNTTGRGASFISASNISLNNMNFTNAGTTDLDADNSGLSTGDNLATNAAIHLQSVTTAGFDNINITGGAEQGINGNTVANFTLANSTITNVGNAADEDNIHFFNMSGTSSITNTTLTHTAGGGDDNLNLQMTSGNLDLTILGGSAVGTAGGVNQIGSGYLFGIRGTSTANIYFEGASSTNNFSGGIVADAFDSATMNLRVNNTTSSGNNDQLSVSAGDSSRVDLEATGNILSSVATGDFVVISLLGSAFDNGYIFDARISNNTISVANGLNADGIIVFNAGGGVINTAITNNTFTYAGTQRAIAIQQGQDGAATTRATITGNNIDIQLDGVGNAVNAILGTSGVADPSGAGSFLDLNIGGAGALANTITHSLGGVIAGGDIRVRQRFGDNINLDGYAGGSTDTAAIISYLNSRNNEVSSSTATVDAGSYSGTASPSFITVSVSAASVLEDGATNLVYTFTRNGSTVSSLVANFAITGTATAGTDFAVTGATTFTNGTGLGTITFAAGSATTQITVDPTADADATEFNESVVVDAGNSGTANGSFARGIITDDAPMLAALGGVQSAVPTAGEAHLTHAQLDVIVGAALARWAAAGASAEQLATLQGVTYDVADIRSGWLGSSSGGHVILDVDAAGHGWFVDSTPYDDAEFTGAGSATRLTTDPTNAPAGHMDLLTVVMHEMGEQLGLPDNFEASALNDLMYAYLTTGERRLPSATDAAAGGVVAVDSPAVYGSQALQSGFDAQYYLAHNPDVAASGVDPLLHFDTFGWHEGRNPNAYFDTAGYLAHYSDVAAAGANPLQHYVEFGWHEGRDPSAAFDTNGYLAANPDVAAANVNPLAHYLQFGIQEGRAAVNDGLWH